MAKVGQLQQASGNILNRIPPQPLAIYILNPQNGTQNTKQIMKYIIITFREIQL